MFFFFSFFLKSHHLKIQRREITTNISFGNAVKQMCSSRRSRSIMSNYLFIFFLLTRSLSYSASGKGDWGWVVSVSEGSGTLSPSPFRWESESRSGWADRGPVEVLVPCGTSSCFRMETMIRTALTLRQDTSWRHKRHLPLPAGLHKPTSLCLQWHLSSLSHMRVVDERLILTATKHGL